MSHNAIFIHVPKTGGLFIEAFLKERGFGWLAYRHSNINVLGKVAYENRFKFLFIREPADWYRSYWQMKMGGKTFGERWYMCEQNSVLYHPTWDIDPYCGSDDLDQFIINCSKLDGFLNRMYQQFIGSGRIKVDYIGDQKTLTSDMMEICDHLKIHYDPVHFQNRPKVNVSIQRPDMKPKTRKMINEVEGFYYTVKKGFQ